MIIDARVRLPDDMRGDVAERPRELVDRYDAVLAVQERGSLGRADLDALAERNNIDIALVHAEFEFGDQADVLNEAVAGLVADNPARYRGIGTVSQAQPINVMRAVGQVAECARLGFLGVCLQPAFFHMSITDKHLYPVYAKASELGLVVFLHTGVNYGSIHPIGNERPVLVDEIACAFPMLKLVACHAAWPWTTEMVAVARKHPNVYIEFGGLAPKYLAVPGSGWEVMYRFMNNLLQDQILFGSDWPAFDVDRALMEWRELDLKQAVREKLLGGNAAQLFGLEV